MYSQQHLELEHQLISAILKKVSKLKSTVKVGKSRQIFKSYKLVVAYAFKIIGLKYLVLVLCFSFCLVGFVHF